MKKIILKRTLLFLILLSSLIPTPIFAESVPQKKVRRSLKHYAMHTLVGGIAFIPMIACGALGLWVASKLMVKGHEEKSELLKNLAVLSGATGLGSALYIYYKIPQWIDTYFLHYESVRTTEQNITSLLYRHMFPYPGGVWISEAIIEDTEFISRAKEKLENQKVVR